MHLYQLLAYTLTSFANCSAGSSVVRSLRKKNRKRCKFVRYLQRREKLSMEGNLDLHLGMRT